MVAFKLWFNTADSPRFVTGQPIKAVWGWYKGTSEWFHGYVHHVQPLAASGKNREIMVYAIGASWQFEESGHETYTNLRGDTIISRIAAEHRLSALVQVYLPVIPFAAVAGQKKWKFMVNLAQRCGFTFYMNNTDIRFMNRAINPRAVRAYFTNYGRSYVQQGAIYKWQPNIGETLPGDFKSWRQVSGIDANGTAFGVTDPGITTSFAGVITAPPVFTRSEDGKPFHSIAEARAYMAAQAEKNRHHIRAIATVSGNPNLHQGDTVVIRGIDRISDGAWYVTAVEHIVTTKQYTMEIELGRDSMGDATVGSHPTVPTIIPVKSPSSPVVNKPVVLTGCDAPDQVVSSAPVPVFTADPGCPPIDAPMTPSAQPIPGALINGTLNVTAWQASSVVTRVVTS